MKRKRFYKPISESEQSSTPNPNPQTLDECESIQLGPPLKKRWLELDLGKLPSDHGLRPRLLDYHPSDREKIRRYYFQKGLCQPREINFPLTKFGDSSRKFNLEWYSKYGGWLEYSQKEDAAYCLCCYLMRSHLKEHRGSGEAFITEGFTNWRKSDKFQVHVGSVNSAHNQALRNCQDLMKQKQHIEGYNGASNMRGEYNGLKSLILKENCSTFYIRCFAHQLQLALVTLAKKHSDIASFFNQVANLSNVVGGLCKRRDALRESQFKKVEEALKVAKNN
ncbi:uncharacterized protein [Medicago truncatula]|uniref:uncharacterized protein n=1 Tax=Medicago truncatula TaxID=3880 RepID=UPI0000D5FEDA|nr:uncharacterized protein LOC120579467 [Medicago truncatula]